MMLVVCQYFISDFNFGFPGGSVISNPPANAGDMSSIWVGMIPWRRKWQPTPVLLPGESYGQKKLVGYSPWGCKRVRHDLVNKQQQQHIDIHG